MAVSHEVDQERAPWICNSWADPELDETVEVFNRLTDAIESRMPQKPPSSDACLLKDSDLEAAHVQCGFVSSLLTRVKRPGFQYLAPGLSVPNPSTFRSQPFAGRTPDSTDPYDVEFRPILIFRSTENNDVRTHLGGEEKRNVSDGTVYYTNHPYLYPSYQVPVWPAGLYAIDEADAQLWLPFGTGVNGYARTSDGARFGERTEHKQEDEAEQVDAEDRFGDLYQPGYHPFIEGWGVRLVRILESWLGTVECGDWTVEPEGVQEDIRAFAEADTEEGWSKFYVPFVPYGSPLGRKGGLKAPIE